MIWRENMIWRDLLPTLAELSRRPLRELGYAVPVLSVDYDVAARALAELAEHPEAIIGGWTARLVDDLQGQVRHEDVAVFRAGPPEPLTDVERAALRALLETIGAAAGDETLD